jgi:hypothetical protein
MRRFSTAFFLAFGAALGVALLPLIVMARLSTDPPKPPYPLPGRQFVAEYAGAGANVAHMLYFWGLFGHSRQIRNADVLLIGSSHMQFGLSARELSAALSLRAGRKINVFNLGLGCSTDLDFDATLLDHINVHDKIVVADASAYHHFEDVPFCFPLSKQTDPVEASFKALALWAKFTWDWTLDGWLPEVRLDSNRVSAARFLGGAALILDWNSGDVASFSRPTAGEVFPTDGTHTPTPILQGVEGELHWDLLSGTIPIPAPLLAVAERRHLQLIFTLIPYIRALARDGRRYAILSNLLSAGSQERTAPYLPISATQLDSFDLGHLTGRSRSLASLRLADEMAAEGLIPVTSGPRAR